MGIAIYLFTVLWTISGVTAIWNGSFASEGQFPYVVEIFQDHGFICTGSIISPYHILTAGHCFQVEDSSKYSVVAGRISRQMDDVTDYMEVEKIIVGNDKVTGKFPLEHDIAILKLRRKLTWSDRIRMIFLITERFQCTCCTCQIAGWGRPIQGSIVQASFLRWVSVNLLGSASHELIPSPSRFQLAAYDPLFVAAAAKGDSGAPLVCNGYLTGVVVETRVQRHIIYVDLLQYVSFIFDAVMGALEM